MKYGFARPPSLPRLRGGLPIVEIALCCKDNEIVVPALVDSGAAISVLPYDAGLELGLVWDEQTFAVDVGGVLKNTPAYGVLLEGTLHPFPPVTLVFAWVKRGKDEVRTILGQMNFFQLFKITFEAYDDTFSIDQRTQ